MGEKIYEKRILLGITNDDNVVFANIEFRRPENYDSKSVKKDKISFSAYFDESTIFNETEYRNSGRYQADIENFINDMSYEEKAELCKRYNCSSANLIDNFYYEQEDCGGVGAFLDNLLFPETITVNNNDYIFLSAESGQIDLRDEDMKINLDKDLYNIINNYWNKYQLKEISEDKAKSLINSIEASIKENKAIDRDDFKNIDNFLEKYINDNIEHTPKNNQEEEDER